MRRFALLIAGLALLAGVAATLSGGATQAEARWVITDLGTLGGGMSSVGSISTYEIEVAGGINERGQIVGMSWTRGGGDTAFLWENGNMRAIGLDKVVAINDRSQIVGSCSDPGDCDTGGVHAVLWTLKP